ncbi:MAG: cytochrome c3 family protein [Rubripirellula sp.]
MARETGKQRSQRIEIDYYRKKGGLHRLKTACVLAALVGSGVYVAYVLAAGGQTHTSTGPLSRAHASFENDCKQCHEDFRPIDAQGAKLNFELVGISSKKSIDHIESSCQKCHEVGDHYRDTMKEDWQLQDKNCGGCHADHKGRDFDLNLIAANKCTSCHSGLAEGCQGQPTVRANIAAFTKEAHGDFASLSQADTGTIKFDHQQHMLPGQVNQGEKGAFTLAMLDEALRPRYRKAGQDDSAAVTLDCGSCHEMAGNPGGNQTLAFDAELGRYIKPIAFEQHCAACHSMNPGIATANTAPLPHAVPWAKIDLLLQATITGGRASGQTRAPRDDRQDTPQPGAGLGSAPADTNPIAAASSVQAARQLVHAQCLQCQYEASITHDSIRDSIAGVSQPMIPPRWFVKGLYDHGIHREIDCRYCHDGAYPTDGAAKPALDQEQVMIAGIDTCTGCHRDAETPTPQSLTSVSDLLGSQTTWASDNCTTCHRYHTPLDKHLGSHELAGEASE